jgi:hypothetical protein
MLAIATARREYRRRGMNEFRLLRVDKGLGRGTA